MHITKSIDLGFVAVTRGVHNVSLEHTPFKNFVLKCLKRFSHKDWGDTCSEDSKLNNLSLKDGSRILATYNIPSGLCGLSDKLWIIAEAVNLNNKREYTTVLFPTEY